MVEFSSMEFYEKEDEFVYKKGRLSLLADCIELRLRLLCMHTFNFHVAVYVSA